MDKRGRRRHNRDIATQEDVMLNADFKETILRLLPQVQTPAQYIGGELNSVVKDHRKVRGKLCLAFPDLYIIGDGEESLPWITERWMSLQERGGASREEMLAELVAGTTWAYAPRFYEPEYHADGTIAAMHRTRSDVPREITACTIDQDLDAIPLPTRPVVPYVETPHDRIAIEIMRGCPWQCRFCQSTVIKRPLRVRSVETIVRSALDSYRSTGHNEISLLS